MNQTTNIHPDASTEIEAVRMESTSWLRIGDPSHGVTIFTPGDDAQGQIEFCQTLIDRLVALRGAILQDEPLNTRLGDMLEAEKV